MILVVDDTPANIDIIMAIVGELDDIAVALNGEDALTIILNLKKVIFKLDSNEKVTLKLKKKGKGEIKASDIELPTGVEIVNPEQYLFTISDKSREKFLLL